jgi:hypothetical protein
MMNASRATHFVRETFAPGLTHHVFLIAVRGEPQTPILHRGNPLHPMQVISTRPGDVPSLGGLEGAIGPLPALPAPHRPMPNVNPSTTLIPREITGEILRDASGKLYEKVGDYVRPVNQLFTGSRGQMIDLAPIRGVANETAAPSASRHGQWRAAGAPDESAADPGDDDAGAEHDGNAPPRSGVQRRERLLRELVRRLVPEPGLWRLVRYADFIDIIMPQLADQRRLQPGHQLACYLQVYEVGTTVAVSALEDAAARELGTAGKLMPLSYDLCRKFALSLPRPAFALAAARQAYSPGIVAAGARFMTLRVALDPTAEQTAPLPTSAIVPSPAAVTSAPLDAFPNAPTAVTTPGLMTSIPEEFSKPWDFRLSRDEALYDMTLAASRGAWQRLLDRLVKRISARAMKRWHALLFGKTPDQQLWAVKPPNGALRDARIRRWAAQTLQLGSYDVTRMLAEWEVRWRRRGL